MARPKWRSQAQSSDNKVQVRWSLEEAFQLFLRAKRLEQLRPRTIEDHERHFVYLTRWLKSEHPDINYVDQVTTDTIRDYLDFMLMDDDNEEQDFTARMYGTGLSPVTVNVRLRTLKTLFRWLTAEGFCQENPAQNIHLLRTEEDTIQGFSTEQIALLLAQPDLSTYVGFRDYALMLFLLDTGARIRETLSLTALNIDFINYTVQFSSKVTKTRKSRIVPVSQKTINCIKELLAENKEHFGEKVEHIFLSIYGTPMDPSTIRHRLREYGKQAGIENICRVSPHTFRHTFGRLCIRNGGDVFTLQKILGHSTMEMVRKYIQMAQEDLQDAHAKFSPLNNLNFYKRLRQQGGCSRNIKF